MKAKSTLMVALVAGCVCTSAAVAQMGQTGKAPKKAQKSAQKVSKKKKVSRFASAMKADKRVATNNLATAERAKVKPEILSITHITSGKVHVPGQGTGTRGADVCFDNFTDADSTVGFNVSYVNAGSYNGTNTSSSAYLFGMASCANTQYTNNAPPCFFNAPYSAAQSVPLPTDIVWDEYAGDPVASPAGCMDDALETLCVFQAIPLIVNTETNGSDRVNTIRYLWFDITTGCFVDGFLVSYLAPANFAGWFNDTYDLTTATFTVSVPNIALAMIDWNNFEANQSPNSTTGDEGVGHMIAGGQVLGAVGFPTPNQQWVLGSTDFNNWLASDGVTNFNNLADTVCPGGGSTSTYTDVLLSTQLINWFFTDGATLGLASDFPRRITVDNGGSACLADVGTPCGTPNGTVNSDDYVCYLGLFAAANLLADVTGPGGCGVPNGVVNSDDYVCYLSLFAAGCP